MTNSNQVSILMATYNGARYLEPQLKSLYAQTYPNCKIFVRDDVSVDSTLAILREAEEKDLLSLLPSNSNLGPAASFFTLLCESSSESAFYAFCDQDDIWQSEKIQIAVTAIQQFPQNRPILYCTRVTYVDENNQFIKLSPLPRVVGFGNALVENIVTGCTIVMNKAARDLIIRNLPSKCLMHDSWCYLLISCLGEVIYDPTPNIRYRQHASNTIGASTTILQTICRRFQRFRISKHGAFRFSNQAEIFLKLYQDIIPENFMNLLMKFVDAQKSPLKRMALAFSPNIWRQTTVDNLLLRILILINRY